MPLPSSWYPAPWNVTGVPPHDPPPPVAPPQPPPRAAAPAIAAAARARTRPVCAAAASGGGAVHARRALAQVLEQRAVGDLLDRRVVVGQDRAARRDVAQLRREAVGRDLHV